MMNKKHVGSSVSDTFKEWDKNPIFKAKVDRYVEKKEMGMLLKRIREKEALSQAKLAQMARVPQSVIARIESPNARTLPQITLYSKIINAMGYQLEFSAVKG
jgi:ribosome-binding protein aMBF1 (putative translation factor)